MTLRETLETLMAARGENPHSLSLKSGVPQPTIFRILKGDSKDPRRSNVDRLARALGVTAEKLYGGSGALPLAEPRPAYAVQEITARATSALVLEQLRGVLAPMGLSLEDVLVDVPEAQDRIEAALTRKKRPPATRRSTPGRKVRKAR